MNNLKEKKIVEQIYLDQDDITEEEKRRHIDRYGFAQQYLKPNWLILDAACGSGYGSEILSQKVKKIIGIDINQGALNYAKKNHFKRNIEYLKGDLNQKIKFPDESFDAIVSFETLEHIKEQQSMLSQFKRILKKGGLLIISTPDKTITEKENIKNPHHFMELTKKEFCSLLSNFFRIEELYGQTEFKNVPKWQRSLKSSLVKLDFLNLRGLIIRRESLRKCLNARLSTMVYTPIKKIEMEGPSKHWVLIAICKKL